MSGASANDDGERPFFGRGLREGDVLAGRYRVLRELGSGGMGQVVEIEHVELEKRFALKLIRPDRWDASLEARFRREAKALARVSSPRVAQVTDFGVDPERGPFYVMELVEGRPLDAVLRDEGPMPRERALTIAIGIAEALADVHAAGIVHRDVKPGNIGVCARGPVPVRLLDFGLATSIDEHLGSKITQSRRVIGSFPYMAPEQFHGETPTPRIDVWALGIVLFELLTGEVPFESPSTAGLIHKILYNEVPMAQGAPRGCSRVFDRLLAKAPEQRPANAAEALELLRAERASAPTAETRVSAVTAEATIVDPRLTPVSRRRAAPTLAIGVALGTLGIVGLMLATWTLLPRDDRGERMPHADVVTSPLPAPIDRRSPSEAVAETAARIDAASAPSYVRMPYPRTAPELEPTADRTRRPRRARAATEDVAPAVAPPPAAPETVTPAWTGGIIEAPSP